MGIIFWHCIRLLNFVLNEACRTIDVLQQNIREKPEGMRSSKSMNVRSTGSAWMEPPTRAEECSFFDALQFWLYLNVLKNVLKSILKGVDKSVLKCSQIFWYSKHWEFLWIFEYSIGYFFVLFSNYLCHHSPFDSQLSMVDCRWS